MAWMAFRFVLCLSLSTYIQLSCIYPFQSVFLYLSVHQSIVSTICRSHWTIQLAIYLSVCPSFYLCIYLSSYLKRRNMQAVLQKWKVTAPNWSKSWDSSPEAQKTSVKLGVSELYGASRTQSSSETDPLCIPSRLALQWLIKNNFCCICHHLSIGNLTLKKTSFSSASPMAAFTAQCPALPGLEVWWSSLRLARRQWRELGTAMDFDVSEWLLQGGTPWLAKLVYNSNNQDLW